MKRGQSELRVSPVGAVSNTLRSNLPSSPHRYRPRVPPSHCTSADFPPSPASTSVPTLPSPPSWSSQHQSGPRTRRRPKQSSIALPMGAGEGLNRGFPFSLAPGVSGRPARPNWWSQDSQMQRRARDRSVECNPIICLNFFIFFIWIKWNYVCIIVTKSRVRVHSTIMPMPQVVWAVVWHSKVTILIRDIYRRYLHVLVLYIAGPYFRIFPIKSG